MLAKKYHTKSTTLKRKYKRVRVLIKSLITYQDKWRYAKSKSAVGAQLWEHVRDDASVSDSMSESDTYFSQNFPDFLFPCGYTDSAHHLCVVELLLVGFRPIGMK